MSNWIDPASPEPLLRGLFRKIYAYRFVIHTINTSVNSIGNDDWDIFVPMSEKRP